MYIPKEWQIEITCATINWHIWTGVIELTKLRISPPAGVLTPVRHVVKPLCNRILNSWRHVSLPSVLLTKPTLSLVPLLLFLFFLLSGRFRPLVVGHRQRSLSSVLRSNYYHINSRALYHPPPQLLISFSIFVLFGEQSSLSQSWWVSWSMKHILLIFRRFSQTVGHIFTHFHSGTHFHRVAVTFQKQWRPTALIAADSLSKRHHQLINVYVCIVQQQIN